MTLMLSQRIVSSMLFWPVLKTYILRWMVGFWTDGHKEPYVIVNINMQDKIGNP